MPGIFSPVLETDNTAIRPVEPVGNNLGQGLANIGSLIGGFAGSNSNGRDSTQSERNNAALLPLAERLAEIQKMDQTGQLKGFQKRALVEETVINFTSTSPILNTEALALANQITGLDVNLKDLSPEEVALAGQHDWATTMEGQYFAARSMVFDKNGHLDPVASQEKFDQFYLQSLADKYSLEASNRRITMLQNSEAERDIVVENETVNVTNRHFQSNQEHAAQLITNFQAQLNTGQVLDAQTLLQQLNGVISVAETRYAGEMGVLGVNDEGLNNDIAIKPLYALRDYIERNRDSIPKLAAALKAKNEVILMEFTKKITGVGPTTDDAMTRIFLDNIMIGKMDEVRTKMETPDAFLQIEGDIFGGGVAVPTETEDGAVSVPIQEDVLTGMDVVEQVTAMSEEDLQKSSKGMFAFFSSTDLVHFQQEETREAAVQAFGRGVAATNALENGGVLSNNTLKKIYSPEFMKRYENIAKYQDMHSRNLQQTVLLHLYHQMNSKATILERDIKKSNHTLMIVNDKIEIVDQSGQVMKDGVGPNRTTQENYERSGLAIGPTSRNRGLPSNVSNNNAANKALVELNEVYQMMKRFSDLRTSFTELVNQRFTPVKANSYGGLTMIEVASEQDYINAPSGSIVVWRSEDGSITTGVKP